LKKGIPRFTRINPIIVIRSKRRLVLEREMSILVKPNQYPDDQEGFGRLALNDFEALETRRSVALGVEFPSVTGKVTQRGNILTI
jgi:hypothetical protein